VERGGDQKKLLLTGKTRQNQDEHRRPEGGTVRRFRTKEDQRGNLRSRITGTELETKKNKVLKTHSVITSVLGGVPLRQSYTRTRVMSGGSVNGGRSKSRRKGIDQEKPAPLR